MTTVQPTGRFGAVIFKEDGVITSFMEKPKGEENWINGGYFVCEPEIFDYIGDGLDVIFEKEPLENIAKENKLNAYKHYGFWKPMDTLNDNKELNTMWDSGKAPWKIW